MSLSGGKLEGVSGSKLEGALLLGTRCHCMNAWTLHLKYEIICVFAH